MLVIDQLFPGIPSNRSCHLSSPLSLQFTLHLVLHLCTPLALLHPLGPRPYLPLSLFGKHIEDSAVLLGPNKGLCAEAILSELNDKVKLQKLKAEK